jgi:hypothetical protein
MGLVVTNTGTQAIRHLEWGLEGPLTYNPATSLLIDSDSLVTSGFAGAQSTLAGAYDANATGGQQPSRVDPQSPVTQAVCGTGVQAHVGSFRVKARVNSGKLGGDDDSFWRLSWQCRGRAVFNEQPVGQRCTPRAILERELDLGVVTVPVGGCGHATLDGPH